MMNTQPSLVLTISRIALIDGCNADAPIGGSKAAKRKHDERGFFEHCKNVYLDLREQYETQSSGTEKR